MGWMQGALQMHRVQQQPMVAPELSAEGGERPLADRGAQDRDGVIMEGDGGRRKLSQEYVEAARGAG